MDIEKSLYKYFTDKFNTNSYGVKFVMGSPGNPIFRFITQDDNSVVFDEDSQIVEEYYSREITNVIPMSLDGYDVQFLPYKDLQQTTVSATLSFLCSQDNIADYQTYLYALNEIKDDLKGDLDMFPVYIKNYSNKDAKPTLVYYNMISHSEGILPIGSLDLQSKKFMMIQLIVHLDISKDIAYGNQFEFYIQKKIESYKWETPIQELTAPYDYGSDGTLQLVNLPSAFREGLKARIYNPSGDNYWVLLGSWRQGTTFNAFKTKYDNTAGILKDSITTASSVPSVSDLPDPTTKALGFVIQIRSTTPISSSIIWSSLEALAPPFDYDLTDFNDLPSPASIGLKARILTPTTKILTTSTEEYYNAQDPSNEGEYSYPAFGDWSQISTSSLPIGFAVSWIDEDSNPNYFIVEELAEESYTYYQSIEGNLIYDYYYFETYTTEYYTLISVLDQVVSEYSERIYPIEVVLNRNNELVSTQILNIAGGTEAQLEKAKELHSTIQSSSYAIAFELMFQPKSPIIKELFSQIIKTSGLKMNRYYDIKIMFKTLELEGTTYVYKYDTSMESIKRVVVVSNSSVIRQGEDISFVVAFAPAN